MASMFKRKYLHVDRSILKTAAQLVAEKPETVAAVAEKIGIAAEAAQRFLTKGRGIGPVRACALAAAVGLPGLCEIRKSKRWTVKSNDGVGGVRYQRGYTDRQASKVLAADVERSTARGEAGLVNPFKAHRATSFTANVEAYISELRTVGRDPDYIYRSERRLKLLGGEAEWSVLGDVTADSFVCWRVGFQKSTRRGKGRDGKPPSARVQNHYLETLQSFLNWCASKGKLPGAQIRGRVICTSFGVVEKVAGQQKRPRRAFTEDELARFMAVVPAEFSLVVRMALFTALRRSELLSLQWRDLKLNAIQPLVTLRAEATKANRADVLPLRQDLANELRELMPGTAKEIDRVFEVAPTMRRWKNWLAAAGIHWKDAAGRQLDFHGGTRKTFCTRLNRAGVAPRTAMALMRHTDMKLTMIDYVDAAQLDTRGAVEALGVPVAPPKASTNENAQSRTA